MDKISSSDADLISTVNAHLRQVGASSAYNTDAAALRVITGSILPKAVFFVVKDPIPRNFVSQRKIISSRST
jgi:hypothetical protein